VAPQKEPAPPLTPMGHRGQGPRAARRKGSGISLGLLSPVPSGLKGLDMLTCQLVIPHWSRKNRLQLGLKGGKGCRAMWLPDLE
jgi:hypothetical protein